MYTPGATITSEELLLVSAFTRRAASVIDRRGRSGVPGFVSIPEPALTKSCWAADGPASPASNTKRGKAKGVLFSANGFTLPLYPSPWQLSSDLFRTGLACPEAVSCWNEWLKKRRQFRRRLAGLPQRVGVRSVPVLTVAPSLGYCCRTLERKLIDAKGGIPLPTACFIQGLGRGVGDL